MPILKNGVLELQDSFNSGPGIHYPEERLFHLLQSRRWLRPDTINRYQLRKNLTPRNPQTLDLDASILDRLYPAVNIKDTRNLPSNKKFSQRLPENVVKAIASAARTTGTDPKLLMSVGLQEGVQAKTGGFNAYDAPKDVPYQELTEQYFKNNPSSYATTAERDTLSQLHHDALRAGARLNKEIKHRGFDRGVQAYNGLGKVEAGLYGSKSVLDANKQNFYTDRIKDLMKNVVGSSPDLQPIFNQYR